MEHPDYERAIGFVDASMAAEFTWGTRDLSLAAVRDVVRIVWARVGTGPRPQVRRAGPRVKARRMAGAVAITAKTWTDDGNRTSALIFVCTQITTVLHELAHAVENAERVRAGTAAHDTCYSGSPTGCTGHCARFVVAQAAVYDAVGRGDAYRAACRTWGIPVDDVAPPPADGMHTCPQCGTRKPETRFPTRRDGNRDYRRCRECRDATATRRTE